MMKINLMHKNITSTAEVNLDNVDDFISFLNAFKKKPVKVINDPNPLMCYSGDRRVLPGTNTDLIVQEWDWETGRLKNPEFVDLSYDLSGYRVYNLTPHDIFYQNQDTGEIIKLQPCGIYPRIYRKVNPQAVGKDGLFYLEDSAIVNVPTPYRDVKFIVSRMVFDILPDRLDLIAPNTLMKISKNGLTIVPGFIAREGVI